MVSASRWYVRQLAATVVGRGDSFLFLLPTGEALSVGPVDGRWLSGVLERAVLPIQGKALLQGASREQTRTLGELLREGALVEVGAAEVRSSRKPRAPERPCGNLVVAVTGAIQAIHAAQLVLQLYYRFCKRLDLILTRSAMEFVAPKAFTSFGIRVWTDAFEGTPDTPVPHIALAAEADMVLVAPASAHALQRIAAGACSDLLSLTVAATKAPVVLAPAMNGAMWRSPAVARNVAQLRADGHFVVEPRAGLEASQGADAVLEPGGIGLDADNVVPVLSSLLEVSGRKRGR